MRKDLLKKNNFKKEFRLIEYTTEESKQNAIVVNTIEKEEIFSQEEDIDQAETRFKSMEKYCNKAHDLIKDTFQQT